MSEPFSYDEVSYPSMVFPHIRPDQIGAIAILHGITPENIEDCRVLELGCGDGANLLSIAYTMPNSSCVGVDLSAPRIDEANEYAATIGVGNAEFHHVDLMQYEPEKFGKFDFIIAHGVYSWVPEKVREKILWIYAQSLKPNGVGFISYNAYPGWHVREVVRHAMRFQTEFIDPPLERVGNGIRFVEFLAEASMPSTLYRSILENELEYLQKKRPESVFHDDLADINQPFYFREFVERIERSGLSFVSELEPMSFFIDVLPAFAQEALGKVWNDPIRREQYLDLIRGRFFRSTLVCRPSANPSYRPIPESLSSLYLSTQARAISPESSLNDRSLVAFSVPEQPDFEIDHPLIKSLVESLGRQWPRRLSFTEICESLKVGADNSSGVDHENEINLLQTAIVSLITAAVCDVRCFRPQISLTSSQYPKVSDFARWQASHNFTFRDNRGGVTNLHGAEVTIENELFRELIILSDGTRDRMELAASIRERAKIPEKEFVSDVNLPEAIDSGLKNLARSALLV